MRMCAQPKMVCWGGCIWERTSMAACHLHCLFSTALTQSDAKPATFIHFDTLHTELKALMASLRFMRLLKMTPWHCSVLPSTAAGLFLTTTRWRWSLQERRSSRQRTRLSAAATAGATTPSSTGSCGGQASQSWYTSRCEIHTGCVCLLETYDDACAAVLRLHLAGNMLQLGTTK